jgi:uncharacterized protein YcfJ
MHKFRVAITGSLAVLILAGCATQPVGPTIAVMPAANKPFEVFQHDQEVCKSYASQQIAGQAQVANNRAVGTGLLTTGLGAALGAAVGGGRGAGIGAASGAVVGTAVGANQSEYAQRGLQGHYNIAFAQCMTSKGNFVPAYSYPRSLGALPPPPPPPTP